MIVGIVENNPLKENIREPRSHTKNAWHRRAFANLKCQEPTDIGIPKLRDSGAELQDGIKR
jgi:hypothetical protein